MRKPFLGIDFVFLHQRVLKIREETKSRALDCKQAEPQEAQADNEAESVSS